MENMDALVDQHEDYNFPSFIRELRYLMSYVENLVKSVTRLESKLDDHVSICRPVDACAEEKDTLAYQAMSPETSFMFKTRRRQRSTEDHRQECMRKSLQENIVLLVENLPFSESELADKLIETECLTGDECCDIRNSSTKKDQVRNLVRIIKGRSYHVMNTFLSCVKCLNPELADIILSSYHKKLKDSAERPVCAFCKLKHSVDIKMIADHVWSIDAISDMLYNDIITASINTDALWERISKESSKGSQKQKVIDKIVTALERKGHYNELVSKLRREASLSCRCGDMSEQTEVKFIVRGPDDDVDVDDATTASPISTYSISSCQEEQRISILSDFDPCDDSGHQYQSNINNFLHNVEHLTYELMSKQWRRQNKKFLTINENTESQDEIMPISRSNSISRDVRKDNLSPYINQSYSRRRASMFV